MPVDVEAISAVDQVLSRRRKDANVPPTFLGFLRWLGVEPSPGQAELVRVSFDAVEPVDDRLAATIFGGDVPMGRRRVVVAVCGARAGKTYLLVSLRLLHGMLVRDVSSTRHGQRAVAMVVAPNERLRREALNYALGAVHAKPELAAMLVRESGEMFEMRRPDGKLVYFEGGVAGAGGIGARGRWYTDVAMDECAFFHDSSYKVNDTSIYDAGLTRVLPGGQMILASTPWAQAGLLYEKYRDFYGKPDDKTLVARAPTLLLNDSPVTRMAVEDMRQRDPENAAREYEAEFMTANTTLFFEPTTLDAMVTDEPFTTQPGDQRAAGGDFGFRSDSSALVKVALRGNEVHVYGGIECRPEGGMPLRPSQTVKDFAACVAGECAYLMADQHYREAIAEHLEAHGLIYAPAPMQPADSYVRARMLLRDRRVLLHRPNLPDGLADRLLRQLREVHGKPTSGGGMSIVHPRWATGGHGDLAAAFVLAVWQVTGDTVAAQPPEKGTNEWVAEAREKRQQKMRDRAEQAERMPWLGNRTPQHWRAWRE
jgi:hypothetical protein